MTLGLRGKLLLLGLLLIGATTTPGIWSTLAFANLSRVLTDTLQELERTTAATTRVASALEREDDSLLLAFTGRRGDQQTTSVRSVDEAVAEVAALSAGHGERSQAAELGRAIAAYRKAGSDVLADTGDQAERYHREVNPLLRKAVGIVADIRERQQEDMRRVAEFARDEARRSVGIAAGVSIAALALSILLGMHLARGVVWPIRALTRSVEALRGGDFEQRIATTSRDEIGLLADGFNRMAADLAEFRDANLSEVLRAKRILEATLAALPDGVAVVDPDGSVVATNDIARSLLGDGGVTAAHYESLPLPAAVIDATRSALRGERVDASVDLQRTVAGRLDGQRVRLLPRVVPVHGFAERQGAVLILNDVTDLVRLDEMRMELVAVASHELRTPLTTLRMALLMLHETAEALGDRQRALVQTALGGVEQLEATVDGFLDLTRIEIGQLRLSCERVNVGALIARALGAFRTECEDAGITLATSIEPELPFVRLDPRRVQVVLSNVLSNAIKYTPHGGRIEIGVTREPRDGDRADAVVITVTDTGRGIPPEYRERVFEKFFRVEHEAVEDKGGVLGSGIGLYLAREIAAAHGGAIRCEAAGDDRPGTRIVLRLPVRGPREEVVQGSRPLAT